MLTVSDLDKERRKEHMKNYYYKRRNLLKCLINCVVELENVCSSR